VAPVVTTASITTLTATSVVTTANITSDGGSNITARGVCWNTTGFPGIAGSHTSDGTGSGTFTSTVTGLSPVTTYYLRSYATNSNGTTYGWQIQFTTPVAVPGVTTNSVTAMTDNNAWGGGNVTYNGGGTVTARGLCWNTTGSPTVSDAHTVDGSGTGSFISNITGLTYNTLYNVRAYATNSAGTGYGNEIQITTSSLFTCGTTTATDYDGNVYNTVQIGTQCWMVQNLKTTHYADGTALVDGTSAGYIAWGNNVKYWFVFANNPANKNIYGLMYAWAAVMNGAASSNSSPSFVQGVCPTGWHVPSRAEWSTLYNYVGGQGGSLIESGSSHWVNNSALSTNSTGFTALPGGWRYYDGQFLGLGNNGNIWSATTSDSYSSYFFSFYGSSNSAGENYSGFNNYGLSVRCLRNY
jgi:uncharacterized protein (TIGR02145 family)